MDRPEDRGQLRVSDSQWLARELARNEGSKDYVNFDLPVDLQLKRERLFESMLRQLCFDSGLDYETTLRYMLTRIRQDNAIRSEIRAMEWAETKYQTLFGSTRENYGDLVSMGVDREGNPDGRSIMVVVTSSPTPDLELETQEASKAYEEFWKLKPDVAVGVRTDASGVNILETKETSP